MGWGGTRIPLSLVCDMYVGYVCVYMHCEGQVSITQPVHKVWTVNEGGKLIIVCTSPVGGSVDWLHNDVPIATSLGRNRYKVRMVTAGNMIRHYLTVLDVRQQDAGRYTCRQTYSDHRHINVSRLNGQSI